MIDINKVKYIAQLCRLDFSEEELGKFTPQFNNILKYIEKLNQVDTNDIEPTSHVVPLTNVIRKDEIEKRYNEKEILTAAPTGNENYFIVPRIIPTNKE